MNRQLSLFTSSILVRSANIILFFLLVLATYCCKENNSNSAGKEVNIKRVFSLPPGPNNPRNSEGDFVTLKDGRLLYVYSRYTGETYMDDDPAYLASRFSDDQGHTWSSEELMVVENEGKMNVMSVSLIRLKNGEIALFYLRKNSLEDCIPMLRFSNDEGKTWSEPIPCITDREGYFILHNDRVIQLEDGRLIFSVAFSGKVCSYFSDDNGRIWSSGEIAANPDNVVNQEPGIVELKNGDLYMLMRTDTSVQYESYSTDKGKTWTPTAPSNIVSASQSPASIARIPSTGDLLLVWNWNQNNPDSLNLKRKRTPLNVAISKDEGKTWGNIKIVENYPKGSFCYTAIHFTDNHVLLAYFDWRKLDITITKFSLDWLYNKKATHRL